MYGRGLEALAALLLYSTLSLALFASASILLGKKQPALLSIWASLFVAGSILAGIVVLALNVPSIIRARTTTASAACLNNLRLIESAKEQWALENKKHASDRPAWTDLRPYVGHGAENALPTCNRGGVYYLGSVGETPRCSLDWNGENPH